MKICIVAYSFPRRSETFIREHAIGLAKRGHDVTVISHGPGLGISDEETAAIDCLGIKRVNIFAFPGNRFQNFLLYSKKLLIRPTRIRYIFPNATWHRHELFYADAFVREIIRGKFDVVHVHFGVAAAMLHHILNTIKSIYQKSIEQPE